MKVKTEIRCKYEFFGEGCPNGDSPCPKVVGEQHCQNFLEVRVSTVQVYENPVSETSKE